MTSAMHNTLEQTLKTLIAFETITGNQKETEKALHWLHDVADHLDASLHIEEHCFDTYPALTITTQHTQTPKLWLAAHIDVVPGGKELFRARKENGRLYGRGTYDMKFAIACYMQILIELNSALDKYDFGIMITSDEEIGGWNGTGALVKKGCSSDVCFLPDGGEEWVLEERVKGVWHIVLTSTGISTHGSRPWEGLNAIQELNAVLTAFMHEFEYEPDDIEHFHRTATISNITGGNGATNKVPNFAEATIDIRFTTKKEQVYLETQLLDIEKNHPGVAHRTTILIDSSEAKTKHPLMQAFKDCIPKGKGIGERGKLSHGSSDARFFNAKDIPTIVTRPCGGGAHSNDEWIDLADLEAFYRTLQKYVKKVTKVHS